MSGKVFGIGLNKSGSSSLREALRHLGYRTAHFREHFRDSRGIHTWLAGNFADDDLAEFDAALDLPVPVFFPQLDERYPGSKFILTVRDKEAWLESLRRWWERYPLTNTKGGSYRRIVRLATYACINFSRERMSWVQETHHRNVRDYFADRPDDLLVFDVCAGDSWEQLCPFLGKPIPEISFPWKNRQPPSEEEAEVAQPPQEV